MLSVQQLINDCERHLYSSNECASCQVLLSHLESTLNNVEEGMHLLLPTPLFSTDYALLSTFHTSISCCIRMLQYGRNDCTTPPIFIPSFTLYYSGSRGRPMILLNLEMVELLKVVIHGMKLQVHCKLSEQHCGGV